MHRGSEPGRQQEESVHIQPQQQWSRHRLLVISIYSYTGLNKFKTIHDSDQKKQKKKKKKKKKKQCGVEDD
jgi:hypothetical protein